jgi:ligand-binding sensor domain-containing protein/two-component sensor histidine kinase
MADGLVNDWVNRIVQDSHGFIWFCTRDGLSRFDGYQFTNYTAADGLADSYITGLVETRDGAYWVATWGGLCRFNPADRRLASTRAGSKVTRIGPGHESLQSSDLPFLAYPLGADGERRHVNALIADHAGALWCGTQRGLYRLNLANGEWTSQFVDIPAESGNPRALFVTTLLEDRHDNLWIGTVNGLYQRRVDGRVDRCPLPDGSTGQAVRALMEDRAGQLWVGMDFALCQMAPLPNGGLPVVARMYTEKDGLSRYVQLLFQSSDGKLWVGAQGGFSEFDSMAGNNSQRFKALTTVQGLGHISIEAMIEDRDGNLWMGAEGRGVLRLARRGFITYTEEDGLRYTRIRSVFEDRQGNLCVLNGASCIHRFDGNRFTGVQIKALEPIMGWNQTAFQDHMGDWWVPARVGLYRFANISRLEELSYARPKAIYTTRDGLSDDVVSTLFEDSKGDIWIGTGYSQRGEPPTTGAGLTRWERRSGTFHRYAEADGLALDEKSEVKAFCEDRAGNVWIGLGWTGLVRYSQGRFKLFTDQDGWPAAYVYRLYLDHAGCLWVATTGSGLFCLQDPTADLVKVTRYTTDRGLSSNDIKCITEDRWGDIYIGTGRGVDRLHPATGRITYYSAANGLGPGGLVMVAFRDRANRLWFGTLQGLARFEPEPAPGAPRKAELLPSTLITGLRINGASYPVSELGEAEISGLALNADQNQVRIDFVALSFAPGARLLYQYRLEGVDRDWNAPTEQRTILLGGLSPGNYRFVVRAMSPSGRTSQSPAVVAFTIRPPLWRRGWFLALSGLAMVGLLYVLYRYRVARLIELERVRTRIATDLHDDIGSSLSGMALLSETVVRQVSSVHPEAKEMTAEIAAIARRLVDAMNDIVWAIDPRRDNLANLMLRVRQFASQMLEAKGIAWEFQAREDLPAVHLNSEQRRHLLLIFKEAINNIVRHADCTSVAIALTVADHRLDAVISDNGRGFTVPPVQVASPAGQPGNGLRNMQARAAQLGGHLAIDSAPGRGTRLTLWVPLK